MKERKKNACVHNPKVKTTFPTPNYTMQFRKLSTLFIADTRCHQSEEEREEEEKSRTDKQKGKEQVKTCLAALGNQAEKRVKIPLKNKFFFYYLLFWEGIKI